MKDFAKSIVCNTKAEVDKVGNGLKEDMQRAYPSDTMVNDVKKSATYEAIVRQPWKVYDILGVGDSDIKTYAFNLVSRKYGVPYDVIHKAWLDDGYKLSSWRGKEDQAKRYFQKLGVSVTNEKVGNNAADDKYQAFILKYGHPNTKEEAEKLIELAKKEGIHPDYIKGLKRGFASRWGNSKCGNADEVVHRDGNFKVKFNEKEKGYEVYYNSSYYDTFHTKDQALGFIEKWKKREADRKTGNIKQDAKAKKLYEEMMDAKELAEEWARATHTQKKDNLEGGRKAAEDAYKKAKKAYEDYAMNSKVGNFTVAEGVKGNPGPQYADMIKEAKSLISKVRQKINSYEKAQNINWGHVGDVEHFVRLLRQMV